MTNITQFEAAFIKEQYRVRQILADKNVGSFYFAATAEGRCSSGDVKVEFTLAENSWETAVKGNSVEAVVTEFLRRRDYAKEYNALCLPSVMPKEIGEQTISLNLGSSDDIAF